MTPIVHSSASEILYALPPGKPNPEVPCSKITAFSRPRVEQSAQKGPTCWYYALNMIRLRVGKNPSEDLKEEREIEKIISQRRKLVTAIRLKQDSDQAIVRQLMNDPNYIHRRLWTKEGASKLLPRFKELSQSPIKDVSEEATKLVRILGSFSEQDRFAHLQEYTNFLHCDQINKINFMFLNRLGKNPETYFEVDQIADLKSGTVTVERRWSDVPEVNKKALLDNYFFRASYEKYGLQVSPWHPEDGAQRLVEVLRENGPMYIKGRLGRAYYTADPQVVSRVASREILGWKKGSERIDASIFHSVVVVGASSESRGFVYFVDPQDKSAPEVERPVYVNSYEQFISQLGGLRSRFLFDSHTGRFAPCFDDTRYGLHAPK
jgi:hypothetical protein